ncbi:hypothetical protein M7775_05735 [Sporomusa sphaeroides DSM 2875]|uniref:hypothetical protein n=1 Tax=Sporomusa sphaeroides TaxID=47679 RepID=UPI002030D938|nr:hypothetical protein [Sporomusa sphaeroides]MCM0758077.1 hypothetical protein [Sporomusa sphaeroides DSM 2875]
MPAPQNLIGKIFGRLTVIELSPKKSKKRYWVCKCNCGNITTVSTDKLNSGHTKSCGCLATETTILNNKKYPRDGNPIHHMSGHPLDGVLKAMKQRCYNPNNPRYSDYGGRGITICDEWLKNRKSFFEWAFKTGYKPGLSIDRADNNKGYFPDNCKWVPMLTQNRNTRKNLIITINGVSKPLSEWVEESDFNYGCVLARLRRGWKPEEALGFV